MDVGKYWFSFFVQFMNYIIPQSNTGKENRNKIKNMKYRYYKIRIMNINIYCFFTKRKTVYQQYWNQTPKDDIRFVYQISHRKLFS